MNIRMKWKSLNVELWTPGRWLVLMFIFLGDPAHFASCQPTEKSRESKEDKANAAKIIQETQLAKARKAASDFAKSHPLGLDSKLHIRLIVAEKDPKVGTLLARLAEATGVKFTVADNLSHHDPALGRLPPTGTRVYSFMELLAERDLDNGRWDKTDDGYRLEGASHTPQPPWKFGWIWPSLGAAILLSAIGGFVIYRRRGSKATP